MQVKQAKELGIEATFLGSNSLSDPPFVAAVRCGERGRFVLPVQRQLVRAKFEAFINNYEAKYGGSL